MNHDYKYEGMSEEHRSALIRALGHKEQREERARAMTAQGHTPGPWTVRKLFGDELGWVVEHNNLAVVEQVNEPDARLIAAAPDLLAACKAADTLLNDTTEVRKILRFAIAKAEGH